MKPGQELSVSVFDPLTMGSRPVCLSYVGDPEDLCDRIGVIHKGSLIALGTVGELKQSARMREGALEDIFLRPTAATAGLL
jgi:ABC-type multidrug transport system ATPase subunit